MKDIYRRLMIQHGGEIPFSILGGVHKKKVKKKTERKPRRRRSSRPKTRTTKKTSLPNPTKLSSGTIIRNKGHLWILNKSKKWAKI